MPLISKYIDITVKGLNKKYISYYEGLGYTYPKSITNTPTIRIKIKHLTKGSSARVVVLCPLCNEIRTVSYDNYNKSSDVCLHCSAKIQGKLNTGKGNGQWGKRGKDTPQYIDGRTGVTEIIRKSSQYAAWRLNVYARDGFKCQCCNKIGSNLNCHHIESYSSLISHYSIDKNNWAEFHNELFNLNNGVTLCKKCHKALHVNHGGYRINIGLDKLNQFLHEYEG